MASFFDLLFIEAAQMVDLPGDLAIPGQILQLLVRGWGVTPPNGRIPVVLAPSVQNADRGIHRIPLDVNPDHLLQRPAEPVDVVSTEDVFRDQWAAKFALHGSENDLQPFPVDRCLALSAMNDVLERLLA
jgi:hypothetical protein